MRDNMWSDSAEFRRVMRVIHQAALITRADYMELPREIGIYPKLVHVDDVPGVVFITIVRKWYQRIIPRRVWLKKLDVEIQQRKLPGIVVEVIVK